MATIEKLVSSYRHSSGYELALKRLGHKADSAAYGKLFIDYTRNVAFQHPELKEECETQIQEKLMSLRHRRIPVTPGQPGAGVQKVPSWVRNV